MAPQTGCAKVNFDLRCREHEVTREKAEAGKGPKAPASRQTTPKPSAREMAALIRDLHQLLESYAPQWYSAQIDSRVRKLLAKVEGAS